MTGKRGRPKKFESIKRLELVMETEDYDSLMAVSQGRKVSLSELVRRLIKVGLYVTDDDHEVTVKSKKNPKKKEVVKFF